MDGRRNRIKAHLAKFELAALTLEEMGIDGWDRLVALGNPHSAIREADMMDAGELGDATRLAGQFLPSLVLWAFTVEICLKTLIEQEGGSAPHKHDLKLLFGLCPVEMQDRIRAGVCRRENIGADDFAAELSHNRTVFEEWRYSYEKTGTRRAGVGFLKSLLSAAKAEIRA